MADKAAEEIDIFEQRLKNVEAVMVSKGVQCLLLNQTQTIQFLTGARNTCSWVFLTASGRQIALVLESDFDDYQRQSTIQDIRTFTPHDPLEFFRKIPGELGLGKRDLAIEKEHLRFAQFEMISKFLGETINLDVDADQIVQEARLQKKPEEIEAITRASELAVSGFKYAGENLQSGKTEVELAHEIYQEMIRLGAGYDTYIYLASDRRTSLAHSPPTNRPVGSGLITIDIHASYNGYHSDMARTLFLEKSPAEARAAYDVLRESVLKTILSLREGSSLLEAKKSFYHSLRVNDGWILLTGPFLHGVGIINYELPKYDHPFEGRGYPGILSAGMTIACSNIGLYSRQGWGVRYEDTFVVNHSDVSVLTRT